MTDLTDSSIISAVFFAGAFSGGAISMILVIGVDDLLPPGPTVADNSSRTIDFILSLVFPASAIDQDHKTELIICLVTRQDRINKIFQD